jgi:uncharacterized membrane protein
MHFDNTPSRCLSIAAAAAMLTFALSCGARPQSPPRFRAIEIGGDVPGTTGGSAMAINNSGQVSGMIGFERSINPFRWDNGRLTIFDNLTNHPITYPSDMNDSGVIVGMALGGYAPRSPFIIRSNYIEDLGAMLPGAPSDALAINNLGQVLGWYVHPDRTFHGYIYHNGIVRDLPSFPSYGYIFPLDINDFGQVVGTAGFYLPDSSYVLRAVVVSDERLVDLGTLPGHDISYGGAINNLGHVPGFSAAFEGGRTFLWRDGVMIDTGIAAPPLAMNNLDWIVGEFDERAYLYADGAAYNLNDLIVNGSHWILSRANDVNDRGEIVGYGFYKSEPRPFLLLPTGATKHTQ